MRDVSIRELGHSQYLVSYGGKFSFRAAVENGVSYVGLSDLAGCCGYTSGTKMAQRTNVPKVKIDVRHRDGRKVGKTSPMWFLTVDDAVQFVQERAVDDGFRRWFTGYADTLRKLPTSVQNDTAPASTCPAQGKTKVPEAKPNTGVNISPELIDRIIVDLLALKQGMTSA